jgi:hypothetical protein
MKVRRTSSQLNKVKPVYLYVVHSHDCELTSTHFNGQSGWIFRGGASGGRVREGETSLKLVLGLGSPTFPRRWNSSARSFLDLLFTGTLKIVRFSKLKGFLI